MMKLHLGCGTKILDGWVNLDIDDSVNPDIVHDLETLPWPLESDAFDEILLNHVFEHLGETTQVFLDIMKELYRVAAPNALLKVNVPHPHHDGFLTDPTHVRSITPELFLMFDLEVNQQWEIEGAANSRLAMITGTNFHVESVMAMPDVRFTDAQSKLTISLDDLRERARKELNVIKEYQMAIRVIK
jgi:SAM-dependent methyltransferase